MTLSKSQFSRYHAQMVATPGVEGGFTVHAATGVEPSTGTMVSLPDTEHLTAPASNTRPSALAGYVNRNRASLSQPDIYLGGWKPKTDEFTTIDRSQRFEPKASVTAQHGHDVAEADSLTSALDMGLARNQFSVYNFKRKRSIDTGVDRA